LGDYKGVLPFIVFVMDFVVNYNIGSNKNEKVPLGDGNFNSGYFFYSLPPEQKSEK